MRRNLFLGIAVIETVLACAFVIIGWQIPRPSAADQSFDRADQTTRSAAKQVHLFRGQIGEIRQKDFPKIARQLKNRAETVVGNLRTASIDFATVEAISAALATSSRDLEIWSDALNAEKYLAALADLNDEAIHPSEERGAAPASTSPAAGDIDRGLFGLWQRPELTTKAHDTAPHDLDDARRLNGPKCVEGFLAIRGRCAELEHNLDSTIRQVQILSSVSLPVLSLGSAPGGVEMRPLWPEGRIIATELQKSLDVVKAFNQRLNLIAGAAPQTSRDLADRNHPSADRFRELATELGKNSRELRQTLRTWPALVETMRSSALALKSSQRQLEAVLSQRAFCEHAVSDRGEITGAAEDLFDSCTAQFDARLDEQEKALGQMETGFNDIANTLPPVKQTANDVLLALRWMFWLVAGFIGAHGAFVACDACLKR
jgi:hypothetical protein